MDARALVDRLAGFPAGLAALLRDLPGGDWWWRPPEGGWSILEVVGHLLDEETDDFRTRLRLTLEDPEAPWPPMDPPAAVVARRHQERAPRDLLDAFARERAASVAWLRGLGAADWERTHRHPKFPPLRAGDLLASWAAHDAQHLKQVAKRLHALAARDGAPYDVGYAG